MGLLLARRRRAGLFGVLWLCLVPTRRRMIRAFSVALYKPPTALRLHAAQKKTGGAAPQGFGTRRNKNHQSNGPRKISQKALLQRVEQTYGGTSAQDIAQATQDRIDTAMQQLPPHLQIATQLYQQLQKWDVRLEAMSLLQQTQIPAQEMEGAERARQELDKIYQQHQIGDIDVRNTLQQITWDAAADAKACRSVTGTMPDEIAKRVDLACQMASDAVQSPDGRCLDVGCGFGVLVPFLTKPGRLQPGQVHGVDLSPEMIRNAKDLHPGPTFEAVDFLQDFEPTVSTGKGLFQAVIFCSALHDMPDMDATLRKAWSLVHPGGGRLVIVHPQGATHVAQQSRANPVLVPRGLPTEEELRSLSLADAQIVVAPASTRREEDLHGYLAVLQKN